MTLRDSEHPTAPEKYSRRVEGPGPPQEPSKPPAQHLGHQVLATSVILKPANPVSASGGGHAVLTAQALPAASQPQHWLRAPDSNGGPQPAFYATSASDRRSDSTSSPGSRAYPSPSIPTDSPLVPGGRPMGPRQEAAASRSNADPAAASLDSLPWTSDDVGPSRSDDPGQARLQPQIQPQIPSQTVSQSRAWSNSHPQPQLLSEAGSPTVQNDQGAEVQVPRNRPFWYPELHVAHQSPLRQLLRRDPLLDGRGQEICLLCNSVVYFGVNLCPRRERILHYGKYDEEDGIMMRGECPEWNEWDDTVKVTYLSAENQYLAKQQEAKRAAAEQKAGVNRVVNTEPTPTTAHDPPAVLSQTVPTRMVTDQSPREVGASLRSVAPPGTPSSVVSPTGPSPSERASATDTVPPHLGGTPMDCDSEPPAVPADLGAAGILHSRSDEHPDEQLPKRNTPDPMSDVEMEPVKMPLSVDGTGSAAGIAMVTPRNSPLAAADSNAEAQSVPHPALSQPPRAEETTSRPATASSPAPPPQLAPTTGTSAVCTASSSAPIMQGAVANVSAIPKVSANAAGGVRRRTWDQDLRRSATTATLDTTTTNSSGPAPLRRFHLARKDPVSLATSSESQDVAKARSDGARQDTTAAPDSQANRGASTGSFQASPSDDSVPQATAPSPTERRAATLLPGTTTVGRSKSGSTAPAGQSRAPAASVPVVLGFRPQGPPLPASRPTYGASSASATQTAPIQVRSRSERGSVSRPEVPTTSKSAGNVNLNPESAPAAATSSNTAPTTVLQRAVHAALEQTSGITAAQSSTEEPHAIPGVSQASPPLPRQRQVALDILPAPPPRTQSVASESTRRRGRPRKKVATPAPEEEVMSSAAQSKKAGGTYWKGYADCELITPGVIDAQKAFGTMGSNGGLVEVWDMPKEDMLSWQQAESKRLAESALPRPAPSIGEPPPKFEFVQEDPADFSHGGSEGGEARRHRSDSSTNRAPRSAQQPVPTPTSKPALAQGAIPGALPSARPGPLEGIARAIERPGPSPSKSGPAKPKPAQQAASASLFGGDPADVASGSGSQTTPPSRPAGKFKRPDHAYNDPALRLGGPPQVPASTGFRRFGAPPPPVQTADPFSEQPLPMETTSMQDPREYARGMSKRSREEEIRYWQQMESSAITSSPYAIDSSTQRPSKYRRADGPHGFGEPRRSALVPGLEMDGQPRPETAATSPQRTHASARNRGLSYLVDPKDKQSRGEADHSTTSKTPPRLSRSQPHFEDAYGGSQTNVKPEPESPPEMSMSPVIVDYAGNQFMLVPTTPPPADAGIRRVSRRAEEDEIDELESSDGEGAGDVVPGGGPVADVTDVTMSDVSERGIPRGQPPPYPPVFSSPEIRGLASADTAPKPKGPMAPETALLYGSRHSAARNNPRLRLAAQADGRLGGAAQAHPTDSTTGLPVGPSAAAIIQRGPPPAAHSATRYPAPLSQHPAATSAGPLREAEPDYSNLPDPDSALSPPLRTTKSLFTGPRRDTRLMRPYSIVDGEAWSSEGAEQMYVDGFGHEGASGAGRQAGWQNPYTGYEIPADPAWTLEERRRTLKAELGASAAEESRSKARLAVLLSDGSPTTKADSAQLRKRLSSFHPSFVRHVPSLLSADVTTSALDAEKSEGGTRYLLTKAGVLNEERHAAMKRIEWVRGGWKEERSSPSTSGTPGSGTQNAQGARQ